MSEELEYYIDKLFLHYNVQTIIDLAKAMGITQSAISNWRGNESISAMKKQCMKLGIHKEIFGELH
jgi:Holliday junction resolvasome RuvABC endonuclease subunit